MKHVFGPVPSRRLGWSLGIDAIPRKLCTLDCVYCELGPTRRTVLKRIEYVRAANVVREIETFLAKPHGAIDWITFSGSGEPTLNSKLGEMIRRVKAISPIPIAVITNGTLLSVNDVRKDLQHADVVLPSLDAVRPRSFDRVNRPHATLRIDAIIDGLKRFRRVYGGQIWLEILLVRGINDTEEEVERLADAVNEIRPDKVQLNTVVRPQAEKFAKPVSRERMEKIRQHFGDRCEAIGGFSSSRSAGRVLPCDDAIVALLERRPMTIDALAQSLSIERREVRSVLRRLREQDAVEMLWHGGTIHVRIRRRAAPTIAQRVLPSCSSVAIGAIHLHP